MTRCNSSHIHDRRPRAQRHGAARTARAAPLGAICSPHDTDKRRLRGMKCRSRAYVTPRPRSHFTPPSRPISAPPVPGLSTTNHHRPLRTPTPDTEQEGSWVMWCLWDNLNPAPLAHFSPLAPNHPIMYPPGYPIQPGVPSQGCGCPALAPANSAAAMQEHSTHSTLGCRARRRPAVLRLQALPHALAGGGAGAGADAVGTARADTSGRGAQCTSTQRTSTQRTRGLSPRSGSGCRARWRRGGCGRRPRRRRAPCSSRRASCARRRGSSAS